MKEYKRLRSCSADVLTNIDWCHFIFQNTETGEVVECDREGTWYVLRSYASVVAIVNEDGDLMFRLPRWNYSVTTQSHIRKFKEDYCVPAVEVIDVTHFAEIADDIEPTWNRINWQAW